VRRVVFAAVLALVVWASLAGDASAAASEPRCCKPGSLPFTGVPLYVPVLASIGLIGAGVALRRRTREEL
jgi:hypothetical protein